MSKQAKHYFALIMVLSAMMASPAFAWDTDWYLKTVSKIGSHGNSEGNSTGFLSLTDPLPANCMNGVLYWDLTTPLGKSMLNTLILAKTTGQKVRIGFTMPTTVPIFCTLSLAALE